ncbi:MAG: phosphoribosylformylglycinamidine synthase subunit PurQ [Candidatus Pacearchaeota archaeon]|nr:phosphoribosylformylglycinamidine synthase subunit PurQ [Candidatus Pacearchaeota archaeon]
MIKPNVLVLTGYGVNCDEETKFAFERVGAKGELVHVNDLIDGHRKLSDYQILVFPGGFSYGDDTGAGNALANRIRNHLWGEVRNFVESDKLAIGICNGFQVMVNLGLLPAIDGNYGARQVALVHNDSARYIDRWVDLEFENHSVWTNGLGRASFPIAHGEGKLYTAPEVLRVIKEKGLVSARYVNGDICQAELLPANPNGSLEDIAAISDESGRIFGLMPHPERAIEFTQHPHWTLLKEQYRRSGKEVPSEGQGIQIFKNGVNYFS